MAIIPADEKVFMVDKRTNTSYGGSQALQDMQQWYTMQDVIDSVGGGISGTQYSYVAGDGTSEENATELQAAYDLAKTITGLNAANRFKIIVGTGKYEFSGEFLIDTQCIDIVSLTGDADVEFPNGINVTANNVFLKGLKTPVSFQVAESLNFLTCDTCVGGDSSFGGMITVSGTFINCIGGDSSFGEGGTVTGTFTNCIGGNYSFGGLGSASGTFTNCTGSAYSFGGFGTASGTFTNCVSNQSSFGVVATGTFTNCTGGASSFGGGGGTLAGKLFYCRLTGSGATFTTVSGGGRTYYCVDGNGAPNNQ